MNLPTVRDARLVLDNRVATLTLARDDVRNALTGTALIDDIVGVAEWVNRCEDVSVLVITGAGAAFSAGGNVRTWRRARRRLRRRRGRGRHPIPPGHPAHPAGAAGRSRCRSSPRSTPGDRRRLRPRQHGRHPHRIDQAKFGETFLNLGIIPGDGGAWFMQRLIGYQQAFELTLSGRIVGAAEAKTLGIVLEVVEPDQLLARATNWPHFAASRPRPQRL